MNSDKKEPLELTKWGRRWVCKEVVVSRNREEHMQIVWVSSFEEENDGMDRAQRTRGKEYETELEQSLGPKLAEH